MFDFAWSELLVIAVVALIVIGPKDLPKVLRAVGKWTARARAIAREFQGSIDQMIRESELEEVRREVEKAASTDLAHEVEKTIDPAGELARAVNDPAGADAAVAETATPRVPDMTAPSAAYVPEPAPAPKPEATETPTTGATSAASLTPV